MESKIFLISENWLTKSTRVSPESHTSPVCYTLILKGYDNAFRQIYGKSGEEVFEMFNQEELYKKALTWTMSIRGAKDNILESLVPTLKARFLIPRQALPEDIVNYDWKFVSKEQIDKGDSDRRRPACPYSVNRERGHREGCRCFVVNMREVEGWEENMVN